MDAICMAEYPTESSGELKKAVAANIIIISLLMSPQLGHRPPLWITYKENKRIKFTRIRRAKQWH
jgi:hypothetical protein